MLILLFFIEKRESLMVNCGERKSRIINEEQPELS